jgi:hypothetical protein
MAVPDTVHYRYFLGQGTLCGLFVLSDSDSVTFHPEKVTCEKCLGLMGRRPREGAKKESPES